MSFTYFVGFDLVCVYFLSCSGVVVFKFRIVINFFLDFLERFFYF